MLIGMTPFWIATTPVSRLTLSTSRYSTETRPITPCVLDSSAAELNT